MVKYKTELPVPRDEVSILDEDMVIWEGNYLHVYHRYLVYWYYKQII